MANRAARRARNLLGHRLWEQLQYIGETRIQALLSLAGDAHLAEQAIRAYDNSHVVDGHPQSAWPSSGTNSIPRFALLWIGMLHDYWMRQRDPTVVRESLPGMRSVLDWYRVYVRDRGIVRVTPGWRFVDWRPGLNGDNQERCGKDRYSCVISVQYIEALQEAARPGGRWLDRISQPGRKTRTQAALTATRGALTRPPAY